MKKIVLVAFLIIWILFVNAQDSIYYKKDSVIESRLSSIDTQLQQYGKQNVITDKITLFSIGIVIIGTSLSLNPTPMLVGNSLCSLLILGISWKADLKLSKHKK